LVGSNRPPTSRETFSLGWDQSWPFYCFRYT